MIKIEIEDNGKWHVESQGKVIDLLAELPIGVGRCLYDILKPCPVDKLREELIKGVFECILMELKRIEKKEGEQE